MFGSSHDWHQGGTYVLSCTGTSHVGSTFTASMTVPTAWSTTALPLGVGVPTTVGRAPGLASKVTAWAGRAATNEAASRVAVAAFNAPVAIHAI